MQQATGGEQRGGGAEVVENLPALDVLLMATEMVDDSQPDAPIQQRIGSLSFPMIVANAAGNRGIVETGGGDRGGGKSACPGCAAQ
jgi:hypothetical protein